VLQLLGHDRASGRPLSGRPDDVAGAGQGSGGTLTGPALLPFMSGTQRDSQVPGAACSAVTSMT
jgi:hypothetical protein